MTGVPKVPVLSLSRAQTMLAMPLLNSTATIGRAVCLKSARIASPALRAASVAVVLAVALVAAAASAVEVDTVVVALVEALVVAEAMVVVTVLLLLQVATMRLLGVLHLLHLTLSPTTLRQAATVARLSTSAT